MSFNVQTMHAFSAITVEGNEPDSHDISSGDTHSPSGQGSLQTSGKQYTFSPSPFVEKTPLQLSQSLGKQASLPPYLSPKNISNKLNYSSFQLPRTPLPSTLSSPFFSSSFSEKSSMKAQNFLVPMEKHPVEKGAILKTTQLDAKSTLGKEGAPTKKANESNPFSQSLQSRHWEQKETIAWWNERTHEREKGNQQEQQEDSKEEEKIASVRGKVSSSTRNQEDLMAAIKPQLRPPKLGVFALYYILTKMGLTSDSLSSFSCRKELELVDAETTMTHKLRLACMEEAAKKEQSVARWDIATKTYSWMITIIGIVTGGILIATGVGAVAGALLIAGGILQLTNQILEITGGWIKIADLIPEESPEKKRAIISWIQIGIAVLGLILAGLATVWGGYTHLGEAMQNAMYAISGIGYIAYGVTLIGTGIVNFTRYEKRSETMQHKIKLAQLKYERQELMEKLELGLERLEQLFENLTQALDFERELFEADQAVNA